MKMKCQLSLSDIESTFYISHTPSPGYKLYSECLILSFAYVSISSESERAAVELYKTGTWH